MPRFTVLLIAPSYASDDWINDVRNFHVEGTTSHEAIEQARKSFADDYSALHDGEQSLPFPTEDIRMVSVFGGHLYDMTLSASAQSRAPVEAAKDAVSAALDQIFISHGVQLSPGSSRAVWESIDKELHTAPAIAQVEPEAVSG